MGDAEGLCNRVPVGMTEWQRARGAAHDWCQFRDYIDPLAQIDTKKKITRLPPFEGEQAGDPSAGQ